ncbi:MAG: tRNA (adenosine(37)-N6)-threonylcarbamoyltransferase complex dimerization subunit type 1 TsaB [Ruminococcaceae bacterium]|nr:tRNA (adenosine(37)-N6)-threonylcarbamoyltransferase complex dimerization subunit type 1 TsaB [Oscillospiraceae bacterium]
MKILALDASSGVASAALVCDDILVGEYTINHKKTHSQTLMPMISSLLEDCESKLSEIDAFAISVGPGSFTGLRIGIATAKGLAHASGKPIVGVSTLEAMAYNLPFCKDLIVPIMDARRDQVYGGAYHWEDDGLCTVCEPCAVSIDEILDIVKRENKKAVFIGDGILRFKEQIECELGDMCEFAFANSNMQRASSVAVLAKKKIEAGEAVSCEKITPVYLRKSQAEREYDEKNNK